MVVLPWRVLISPRVLLHKLLDRPLQRHIRVQQLRIERLPAQWLHRPIRPHVVLDRISLVSEPCLGCHWILHHFQRYPAHHVIWDLFVAPFPHLLLKLAAHPLVLGFGDQLGLEDVIH